VTRAKIRLIPDPALRRLLMALHGKRSGANWRKLQAYNLAKLREETGV